MPGEGDAYGETLPPANLSTEDTLVAPAAPAPTAPARDDRRYTVLRRLGEGGMGVVHEAFDAQLDRLVALKVVSARLGEADERRDELVAEARSMAKLAHPNVVTVFDVVTLDGRVHVAMELVRGGSLKEWLATPRPWRSIVDTFVAAGRGLAAAHRAGLVHRDFKPANVLIDAEGRPRVGDFGLARSPAGAAADERIVGTLGYMAPEQLRGQPVDGRADQFSFCAALWEALYGERPYLGDSIATLLAAMERGERRVPPPGRVPPWIGERLARGLAIAPAERYRDIDALLAALADDPVARRRQRIAGGALGVVVLGLAGVALYGLSRDPEDPLAVCHTGDALTGVWDASRRAAVADQLGQAAPPAARDVPGRMVAALDGYAATWERAHAATCEHGVRRSLAPSAIEQRSACLDRRRQQIGALVAAMIELPQLALGEGTRAVERLDAIDSCEDDNRHVGVMAVPSDPALAAQVAELRARGLAVEAQDRVGKRGLEGAVDQLLADSERLGYAPVLAQNLRLAARVLSEVRPPTEMEAIYERGAHLAGQAGDPWEAINAMSELAFSVGYRQRRYDEGLAMVRALEPSLYAAGDPPLLRVMLIGTRASILQAKGDLAGAIAAYQEAIAVVEKRQDSRNLLAFLLTNHGNALAASRDLPAAIAAHRRALAIFEELHGPSHPRVGTALGNLGDELRAEGRFDEARVALERARDIFEAGGASSSLAITLQNLGALERDVGHDAVARGHYERALAIWTQVAGADSPQTAVVAVNLGRTLLDAGDAAAAVPVLERAVAVLAPLGEKDTAHLYALAGLGVARAESGEVAAGVAQAERAYALAVEANPGAKLDVGLSLARALIPIRARHAEARALARAIADGDYNEVDRAAARRVLERLLP